MKNIPTWVFIVLGISFISLVFSPFVGFIAIIILIIYLNNHGYLKKDMPLPRKKNPIPNAVKRDIPRPNSQKGNVPPQFVRKVEFLSNREIAFSNFTSIRYLEESGSHQMIDVKNPKNAKVFIRLNSNQFDVFIDCNGQRAQLSFEKENLEILNITNHGISMIEGNNDDSYLKIEYSNQFFTTLEVEALVDFFHEFSIHNKTTKFQEQSYVEDVPVQPHTKPTKKKMPLGLKTVGVCVLCFSVLIGGVIVYRTRPVDVKIEQSSMVGNRTNTKYFNEISYEVNNEIKEDDWGTYEMRYIFSNKEIPQVIIRNDLTDTDYTEIYNYEKSTFVALEDELDCYEYKYDGQKKQYDFVNLENGKWYHFSGILDKDDIYDNKTNKNIFVDIYVMPTTRSLVQVTMYRTYDDTCDYDITEFISKIDLSNLMTINM